MDQYLTNGSRSIPIVIVLDDDFRELGHWGPRPAELQAWVMANRGTITEDRAVSAGAEVVRAGPRRDDAARGAGGRGVSRSSQSRVKAGSGATFIASEARDLLTGRSSILAVLVPSLRSG